MKQAASNRELRLAENFFVKHIINHPSHPKYSLCTIHVVCESVYRPAVVALEETPFFRSAKKEVFRRFLQESYLCLLMGSLLHTDFLGCSTPTNATTDLSLHGILVPLLHQQGKRWHPQHVVVSKQEKSSGEAQPQGAQRCASSARRVFKRLAILPNPRCYSQDHPWQTCWCRQPVFPIIWRRRSSSS